MKPKLCIYSQPNYLPRTAIEAKSTVLHQKPYLLVQFLIISFAYAKLIRLKSPPSVAERNWKNKIEQPAAQSCLSKKLSLSEILTDRTFENRRSRYKEPSKNKAEAYRVYVEHLFLRSDAGDARIFSKEVTS